MRSRTLLAGIVGAMLGGAFVGLEACTPRIEVAPSDKPITINLNVKIDHEVRVKVDKELDQVLSDKSGLF